MKKYKRLTLTRWHCNNSEKVTDYILEEVSLTILANSKKISSVFCSPWDPEFLAVGHLFANGIINNNTTINGINFDKEQMSVNVLFEENTISEENSENNFNLCISPEKIIAFAKRLESISTVFKKTGAVHCSALADENEILFFFEDVGRHNAIDKLIGKAILEKISLRDKIIIFSGRMPVEIITKVTNAKIPIIISCSAPTDAALEIADNEGLTVIGFARDNCFNVYTHKKRVK